MIDLLIVLAIPVTLILWVSLIAWLKKRISNEKKYEWISFDKELPPYYKPVLCWNGYYSAVCWRAYNGETEEYIYTIYKTDFLMDNPTHWKLFDEPVK